MERLKCQPTSTLFSCVHIISIERDNIFSMEVPTLIAISSNTISRILMHHQQKTRVYVCNKQTDKRNCVNLFILPFLTSFLYTVLVVGSVSVSFSIGYREICPRFHLIILLQNNTTINRCRFVWNFPEFGWCTNGTAYVVNSMYTNLLLYSWSHERRHIN